MQMSTQNGNRKQGKTLELIKSTRKNRCEVRIDVKFRNA